MPKASVVALFAAGPLILAVSSVAFAQTSSAAEAQSPNAAPSDEPKKPKAPPPKAAAAKPPAKGAASKSPTTDKSSAATGDAPATGSKPNDSSATSTTTAADAVDATGDATEANSGVDPALQSPRSTLPTLPRGAGEPNPSPVAGPLLPAGLAPAAEPAPAAATTATAAEKEAKNEDSVFAEDWWSHARPILELHGYFRTRAEMFHNFSLGRISQPNQALWTMPADNRYTNAPGTGGYGPSLCTPGESDEVPGDSNAAATAVYACKNKNNSGANLRFRINPELHISDNLRILSQIDLLDNLVFGSTPAGYANAPAGATAANPSGGYSVVQRNGYAPMSFFDNTTEPPSAGINSYKDSIRVKRVWGEFSTPLGQLRFGRMPDHFGLGMYHNAGDGYDDDYQSTIDRLMFISSIKPLDFYIGGAWDFPSSGATSENLQNPQAQPYNVSNLSNVRQFSLMLIRQKNSQLQRLALSRGNLVVNGGAYLQYRWQDIASDNAGACDPLSMTGATSTTTTNASALGCPSWAMAGSYVRRGARAFTPDLWLQVLYKKFRFEAEAVTVQGSIDNVSNTSYQYSNAPGNAGWKLRSYGIATEIQQRLLEDRLDISLNWGWASGDSNAAQLDGSMGLQPGNNGLQTAEGSNTFREFRFNPAYRVDLILNRNILTRIQGTYYLRPSIGYDFLRKNNGQRLGGNLAGIWTRASEYIQAPGHARDLGIEIDASIYFQSKDGALNDKPGAQGGFFTMLQYGLLFPMGGLGYPSGTPSTAGTAAYYQGQFGNSDLSTAQIFRWYLGIFY